MPDTPKCPRGAPEPSQPVVWAYGPLGPDTDAEGREWCCGLLCNNGGPCPYALKIKPKETQDAVPQR